MTSSRQSLLHRFFLHIWYVKSFLSYLSVILLLPLSVLFWVIAKLRRCYLIRQSKQLPVPIVIVGNISVGGAGKTPVVLALVKALQEKNIHVGVISRGYGNQPKGLPLLVDEVTNVAQSGDEAKLIQRQTGCPVAVGADRVRVARYLLEQHPEVQILISDDGLQHYNLGRAFEIAVVDGKRGMGNGFCLPAGPLREPARRLNSVDLVLVNGEVDSRRSFQGIASYAKIQLEPLQWVNIKTAESYNLNPLPWHDKKSVVAVAAIGNPQRFFTTLSQTGVHAKTVAFDDHHAFCSNDFLDFQEKIVVMTTKDAIKCSDFAGENWWALEVAAKLPDTLVESVANLIDLKS
ncbi:MAG: tetraacyldisaccharide 4'-kinase [Cellvibrionaceae bacterium]